MDSMTVSSPIGNLLLAAESRGLCGLWLEGQKYFAASLQEPTIENRNHPILLQTSSWLERYFAGEKPKIAELPLCPRGSEFRRQVWQLLCGIPYGEVTTYGALARMLAQRLGGKSVSAQAVGGAVGHNPISIIIPCHRVIGADGSLTGYAGGVRKKQWLLIHEGVDPSAFHLPIRGTAI